MATTQCSENGVQGKVPTGKVIPGNLPQTGLFWQFAIYFQIAGHGWVLEIYAEFDDCNHRLRAARSEVQTLIMLMEESTKRLKQGNLPVFMHIALFWCCYMAILVLAWMVKAQVPPQWGQLVWGFASGAALLLLTLIFLRWGGRNFRDVGMNIEAMSVPRLVAGGVIGVATFAVILSLIKMMAGPLRLTRGDASSRTVVISGCTFLALACMEELGFRGYALRTLVRTLGMWRAQAIVAVAFSLCHVAYGWSWINILLGVMPWALVFGLAATSSRGLAMPVGVHAGVNFAQWAVSDNSGIWKLVIRDQLRPRVGLMSRIVGIAMALLVAFLFWRFQNHRKLADTASNVPE